MSTSRRYLCHVLQCPSMLLFPRGVHDGGDVLTLAPQCAKPGDETVKYTTRSACMHTLAVWCASVDLVLSGRLPVGALVGVQERRRSRQKGKRPEGVWGGCSFLWVKWRVHHLLRWYLPMFPHDRQWGAAPLTLAHDLGKVPPRVTPHQKASTWGPPPAPPWTPPWGPTGCISLIGYRL